LKNWKANKYKLFNIKDKKDLSQSKIVYIFALRLAEMAQLVEQRIRNA
jgi:hypothetical protein